MAEKNPIRLNYDGSNPDGFAEFQSADYVGLDDGGTGGSYSSLADLRIGLGLQIGSNVQAYDADLTTISNLVHSDGAFIVSTGTAWQVESGATARTSLGVGTGDSPTFTGLTLSGSATIQGNLDVQGELTSTTSTVITVDDAFVKLNTGNSEADAGIIVDTSDTDDARLFYDVSTNRWVLGEGGTYDEILTQTSTDTLTGKTLDGGSNTFTNLPNSAFSNSSLTFSDGSNSSAVSLGGTVTFTGGAGVDITESSGTLTFTTDLSEITADLTERVDDQVATLLQAGDNITLSYVDGAGTLTISAAVGTEEAQDIVGAQFVTNGSHTGISFAYDDANDGAIDATVSLSPFSTDNLSEGSSNLYYTDTRFDTRLASKDTDNLSEGSSNLYFTNARARTSVSVTDSGGDGSLAYDNSTGVFTYTGPSAAEVRAHFSAGTGVTVSSGQISIGQAVGTTSDVTFNDLVVSGDLTVSGTTTTVNTETINLADNVIVLNSNATGSPTENGGIEIERGDGTNKTLVWNETTDKWTIGTETFVASTFEGNLTGNVTGNVTGTVSSIANHDTDSLSEGSSNLYYTTARFDSAFSGKSTSDLSEGTNLYYTDTRFDTRLATKDTDNLTEGSSNLYYTDARARASVSATASSGLTYNSSTGVFNLSAIPNSNLANSSVTINSNSLALGGTLTLDTDDIGEGSNQYFTTARVDSHLSGGTGIDYSSGTIAIDSTVVTESSTDTLTNKTINFENNTAIIEFDVTVANVSGNKYHLDGETTASIQLLPGITYRFDTSDSSNSGHPLKFSTTKNGTHGSGSEYTTGVSYNGTPGSSGAYTQIVVDAATADTLYYYCQHHSGMGGDAVVSVQGTSLSASDTDDLSEGTSNLYFTNARARSAISVTDSGGDGSLAYNSSTGVITYTGPSATEVRSHFSAGTGITLSGGQISIPQAVSTTSDVTFNDLVVSGDLTVSGTTTTLNTETLTVDDNIIVLNNNVTGTPSENAGIEVERGSSTNKTLIWNETDDKWTVGSERFDAGSIHSTFTGNLTGNVTGTVSSIANHDTDSLSEGSSNLYYTQARFDSAFTAKDTDDLSEGSTNLYYTSTRFNTAFSGKSTSDLTEGTNKYFTDERVDDRVNALLTAGSNITLTYDDNANTLTIASTDTEDDLSNNDTDDLSEGTTNKYFTDERVDDRVNTLLTAGSNISLTYDDAANTLTIASTDTEDDLSNNTTSDLAEGSNLYYTNARADARIALTNLQDLANVGFSAPGSSENQKVVSWDNSAGSFALVSVSGLSGSGETNTASNIGTAGVGLFDGKVGEDLQFKKLNAGSSKITITDDTSNNEVDIDFGTVSINDLSDVDTATSAPSSGQALKWSGSNWIPGDASSAISQLSDVTLTSLATNEVLRYNGSAWVNVGLTTDNTSEGSTNLYFTNARARGAISAASGSGLSYNSTTGELSTASIPNSKLANSSITVTDGSNSTATALGGTITFSGTSNEVEVAESSGTITIGLPSDTTIGNDLTVTNDISVGGDATITGNLTVSGTTTTVNSNTVNIGDSIITLNSDETGSPSQDGGIEIERGSATNKTLVWDETNDKWTVGSETFVAGTFEGNATGLTTTFLTGKSALTSASVADDDVLLVYDTSTTSYKKITKSNLVSGSGSSLTGEAPLTLADSSSDPIEFLNLGSTGTDIDVTLTDGTTDPIQITSTSASATAFRDNDNDTKIQVEATTDADDIRISTAGTERVRIESDGVFDLKSAKLKINSSAGTNGQALVTDGSGNISWGTVATGSTAVGDLSNADTTGLATGDSLVYNGTNFVPQRPTNIEDADGDTRVHVEESSDEDKVRIDTAGTERMIIDNNATMSANGGFFIHRTTMASGETFTISANTGTVAAGPLDIEGTVDVAGTLVVV